MKLLVHNSLKRDFHPERMRLLARFARFCREELDIRGPRAVFIVDDRKKHGISTTAEFRDDKGLVLIYGKGRSFADVMRSLAHEMVHVRQVQDGRNLYGHPHFHADTEDEANADGASLVNAFAEVVGQDAVFDNG